MKTKKITKALTLQHHKIIQQFLDYKARIDFFVDGAIEAKGKMVEAELIAAQ